MTTTPSPSSSSSSSVQQASAVHLASENSDPRQARAELLALVEKFNALLGSLGSAAFRHFGSQEGNLVALVQGGQLPQNLQSSGDSMPTGTILDFFRSTPPEGWLEARGQIINNQNNQHKDLYFILFALATQATNPIEYLFASRQGRSSVRSNQNLQTAEGAWNGSIDLKLPDIRGRTRIGRGKGTGLSSRKLGDLQGEEKIQLIQDHLPNVQLYLKEPRSSGRNFTNGKKFKISEARFDKSSPDLSTYSIGNRTEPMGSDTPHDNMQPSITALTCIKL